VKGGVASDLMRAAHATGATRKMLEAQAKDKLEEQTRPPEPGRAGSGSHFLRAHYQKPSK
jgi:hypothetical protein